jgi:peptidoglycan/LPS O-acetylase OafA/YrhL
LVRHREVPWAAILSAVLYVGNYYNALVGDADTFVSHAWSLGIEEQFYLLWPLALVAGRRRLARLGWCVAGLVLAVWVYRAILHFAIGVHQGYIYSAFDTRVDHLMVGCLLAILLRRRALGGLWQALCAARWLPALTLGLLAVSASLGVAWGAGYRNIVGFALEPLLVAVLLVQLIVLSATGAWAWIDSAPMRYLGRISYSLYLYQQLAPAAGSSRTFGSLPLALQVAVSLGGTLVLAMMSYHLVERPFLALKERLQSSGAAAPAAGRA